MNMCACDLTKWATASEKGHNWIPVGLFVPLLVKEECSVWSHVRNLFCLRAQDLGQIFIKLVLAITGICSPNAFLHSSHSTSTACEFHWWIVFVMSAFFSYNSLLVFQLVTYAPFTLFPTPVPKAVFLQALAVQTHYNTLVDKISQDPDFLEEALAR